MSAFFIAINRDKQIFDSAIAEDMMTQLDCFGHDSKRLVVQDHYSLGYQSSWAVPEEEGERQPLKSDADAGVDGCKHDYKWFMFYGRLDNRSYLLNALGQHKNRRISDAFLAQEYIEVFGIGQLADLIGPFVFVRYDVASGELTIARDGMGARSVSYRITERHILVATNEMALAAHPSVEYALNDETVARYFANYMSQTSTSMIAGLEVLYPGHYLSVADSHVKLQRFYTPDPKRRIKLGNDDEYAAEFRRLLAQAVNRRMRCSGNIGSQLSGGLDSVPITILAANDAKKGKQQLSAYSWVFDQYSNSDERQYSAPLCEKYDVEQISVNCDSRWLSYDNVSIHDPLGPIYNPFTTFNHALFKQAQSRSVKVMLNGIHGDILYDYRLGVLYELVRARKFRALWAEAGVLLNASGSTVVFVKNHLLRPLSLVRRFLHWRNQTKKYADGILQPNIVKLLKRADTRPDYLLEESRLALRPSQWKIVLGDFAGTDAQAGRFMEAQYAIERRYPFRDRDLCEFMLAIPTHMLGFNGIKRPIVKRAFSSDFPANMLSRNTKADFTEVALSGFRNDTQNTIWASSGSNQWSYYVKECYFDGKIVQNDQYEIVKWRCGYYDYWKSVCYHPMAQKLGLNDEVSNE